MLAIWTPCEICGILSLWFADELQLRSVPEFHVSAQVSKTCQTDDVTLSVVVDTISGPCAKIVHWLTFEVKQGGFGWHDCGEVKG